MHRCWLYSLKKSITVNISLALKVFYMMISHVRYIYCISAQVRHTIKESAWSECIVWEHSPFFLIYRNKHPHRCRWPEGEPKCWLVLKTYTHTHRPVIRERAGIKCTLNLINGESRGRCKQRLKFLHLHLCGPLQGKLRGRTNGFLFSLHSSLFPWSVSHSCSPSLSFYPFLSLMVWHPQITPFVHTGAF